jgi:hypothetical protein
VTSFCFVKGLRLAKEHHFPSLFKRLNKKCENTYLVVSLAPVSDHFYNWWWHWLKWILKKSIPSRWDIILLCITKAFNKLFSLSLTAIKVI